MKKLTNNLCYPAAFVKAAEVQQYPPKEGRIGVTTLISSPMERQIYLKEYENITADVDDLFAPMLGTAFHTMLEKNSPKDQRAEKNWSKEFPEYNLNLTGYADVVTEDSIEDYKVTSSWSIIFGAHKEWTQQLNLLNYLRFVNEGTKAKKLKIHAFLKDWSATKAQREQNYPKHRYLCGEMEVWPIEKTEKFIVERMKLHTDPNYVCTDEDRWVRLEKYAIMKQGRKSSIRNLDTMPEAMEYIKKNNLTGDYGNGTITIEQRKSQPRKCQQYCKVRSVCPLGIALSKKGK